MREADRRTIELGIPGLILMENAACRVVEFLVERFSPLEAQRIVIVCGKGNNGGDGLAIARQLVTRFKTRSLDVFLAVPPEELQGDAAENYRMFVAAGGRFAGELEVRMGAATLVIDALLGTGLRGEPGGVYASWIRTMNTAFPAAKIVAVDIPSGLGAASECVRANHTVTFTAPKVSMVLSPACEAVGELIVGPIGTSAAVLASAQVNLTTEADIAAVNVARDRDGHKGLYGHVLVVGGGPGKTGAAAMTGLAALRVGAGLVTVAASDHAGFAPELMSARLEHGGEPIPDGRGSKGVLPLERKTVVAIGPGLGTDPADVQMVRDLVRTADIPVVIDADAITALAGVEEPWPATSKPRILTPHPGEMARLAPLTADRIATARSYSVKHFCCVVLKGNRTVIAFPDGEVWINPTGSPAMAKAGSGDILTGLIAGLVAQFPTNWRTAVCAAVYWHGRAGERAAAALGEKHVLATDLLDFTRIEFRG